MAFTINTQAAATNDGGAFSDETKWIPEGLHPARLIGVIELGLHVPTFGVGPDGKPKPAVYDSGKNKGQVKDPSFEIQTVWATNCEHTGAAPLCLLGGDFDRVKISGHVYKDPSKATNKMQIVKVLVHLSKIAGTQANSLFDLLGMVAQFPVTNKPREKSKVPGMQYANTKLMLAVSSKEYYTKAVAEAMNAAGMKDVKAGDLLKDHAEDFPKIGSGKGEFQSMTFMWDAPTADDWKSLKPWHRKRIKEATNFQGSPVWRLITIEHPELADIDANNEEQNPDDETSENQVEETTTSTDATTAPAEQLSPAAAMLAAAKAKLEALENAK